MRRIPVRPVVVDFSYAMDNAVARFAFGLYLEAIKEKWERGHLDFTNQLIEVGPPLWAPNRLCGRRTVKVVGSYMQFEFVADVSISARNDDSLSLIVSTLSCKRKYSDFVETWRGDNHFFDLSVKETLLTIATANLTAAREGQFPISNATDILECLAFMNAEPETIGTSYDELDELLKAAA